MKDFENCEIENKNKLIPIEEKKSKITFKNTKQDTLRIVEIDDCVIKVGLRCDWLIIIPAGEEFYIELKGSDFDYAVKQLERTISVVSANPKCQIKTCFIISVRCPKTSIEIRKLQSYFYKNYNSSFFTKNSPALFDLENRKFIN